MIIKFIIVLLIPPALCEKPTYNVTFEWSVLNFTWPTKEDYKKAISSKSYIPQNNIFSGIKIYKNNMYLALPRFRNGTPVTLGMISMSEKTTTNIPIKPFPSWELNVKKDCSTLQNVASMEIDSNGIMWVIDGVRTINLTQCPSKLVLFDLNKKGKKVHEFEFPFAISSFSGGYLNDLVIDETDGGFAYITESSRHDPGIVIYSREKDKAWKIRDVTMFAEKETANFTVAGIKVKGLMNVNGIALDPQGNENDERLVYYSSLTGYKIHAISNEILKNEDLCKTADWRFQVRYMGEKFDRSDGMGMDNKGFLYFGLLTEDAIGEWNTDKPLNTTKIIGKSKKDLIWPNSFAFDNTGNMYVSTGPVHEVHTTEKEKDDTDINLYALEKDLYTLRKRSHAFDMKHHGSDTKYHSSKRKHHGFGKKPHTTQKRRKKASKPTPKPVKINGKYKIIKIHTGSDSYLYFGAGD